MRYGKDVQMINTLVITAKLATQRTYADTHIHAHMCVHVHARTHTLEQAAQG